MVIAVAQASVGGRVKPGEHDLTQFVRFHNAAQDASVRRTHAGLLGALTTARGLHTEVRDPERTLQRPLLDRDVLHVDEGGCPECVDRSD